MDSQTGTQMHAGGFGSPPGGGGGGFGPPQGGQPGGFGPPQGGQPPGGFGPPPGGQPQGGFGPPPGGPQGGYGPPMGGEPPKKSHTMMYVGIGCLALLFFTCVCGGGAYWWMAKKAKEAAAALQNYHPTPGTFGVVPPSGGTDSTGGTAPAAGGTCAKAKACCEALYSQPIFQGQGMQACAAVDQVAGTAFAETACTAQLNAFKQAAANIPGGVPAACN